MFLDSPARHLWALVSCIRLPTSFPYYPRAFRQSLAFRQVLLLILIVRPAMTSYTRYTRVVGARSLPGVSPAKHDAPGWPAIVGETGLGCQMC